MPPRTTEGCRDSGWRRICTARNASGRESIPQTFCNRGKKSAATRSSTPERRNDRWRTGDQESVGHTHHALGPAPITARRAATARTPSARRALAALAISVTVTCRSRPSRRNTSDAGRSPLSSKPHVPKNARRPLRKARVHRSMVASSSYIRVALLYRRATSRASALTKAKPGLVPTTAGIGDDRHRLGTEAAERSPPPPQMQLHSPHHHRVPLDEGSGPVRDQGVETATIAVTGVRTKRHVRIFVRSAATGSIRRR